MTRVTLPFSLLCVKKHNSEDGYNNLIATKRKFSIDKSFSAQSVKHSSKAFRLQKDSISTANNELQFYTNTQKTVEKRKLVNTLQTIKY